MKKFWIIFMIILGFAYAGIFSTSFGNQENQKTEVEYPYNIRESYC